MERKKEKYLELIIQTEKITEKIIERHDIVDNPKIRSELEFIRTSIAGLKKDLVGSSKKTDCEFAMTSIAICSSIRTLLACTKNGQANGFIQEISKIISDIFSIR